MNTKELIGRKIKDILVWSKVEVGGLDEARVFIKLDNDKVIRIPSVFNSENIESPPKKGSDSLFADLKDISVYHVNSENKSIREVAQTEKQEISWFGRMKRALGIAYKVHKTEYRENKLKHLKNKKIVDFLQFDDADHAGYLELENGFIITEIPLSTYGTGMTGLKYYENQEAFEDSCGTGYKRLTNKSTGKKD